MHIWKAGDGIKDEVERQCCDEIDKEPAACILVDRARVTAPRVRMLILHRGQSEDHINRKDYSCHLIDATCLMIGKVHKGEEERDGDERIKGCRRDRRVD